MTMHRNTTITTTDATRTIRWKYRRMGLKMNIAKKKVMVIDNTPINVNNVLIENVQGYTCIWDNIIQPQGKEPGQRDTTKNHGRLGGIRQTPGYLQKQPCHLPEETGVPLLCAASYEYMVQRPGHWLNRHRTNMRPHRPKWKEVCSTSHTRIEIPTSGSEGGQKS